MSYMRTPHYIWSDGEETHIDEKVISDEVMEELAVMVSLRILQEQGTHKFLEVAERAYANHQGNFGCEGVVAYLGEPSIISVIREKLELP